MVDNHSWWLTLVTNSQLWITIWLIADDFLVNGEHQGIKANSKVTCWQHHRQTIHTCILAHNMNRCSVAWKLIDMQQPASMIQTSKHGNGHQSDTSGHPPFGGWTTSLCWWCEGNTDSFDHYPLQAHGCFSKYGHWLYMISPICFGIALVKNPVLD